MPPWRAVSLVSVLAGALIVAPALAGHPDRPLRHAALAGVGATWTDSERLRDSAHAGAMLGFDLGLGAHASIGLLGDATRIDDGIYGRRDRVIAGLDLKLLPFAPGVVRPWLMGGLGLSCLNDTGYGAGIGAGVFFVPDLPLAFFVDARRYHFADMESPAFQQVMVRIGVAF